MGIFSKFRRVKDGGVEDDEAAVRRAENSQLEREKLAQAELQREIARATAMKIDAIEAAMAADIFDEPEPVFRRPPRPPRRSAADDEYPTELLDDEDTPATAAAAESAPLAEEAAILHASGEAEAAVQLLREGLNGQDRLPWWMLFDLYQVLERKEDFDQLSLDYATAFETSPPPWNPIGLVSTHSQPVQQIFLSGALDEHEALQIGKLREAAALAPALQLDLGRITAVTPLGCALLLQALREIERPGLQLLLSGADALSAQLRALVVAGGRAIGEAPWLLLLELLRLQSHERAFEEASMDYCLAFEVSPPPYVPPAAPDPATQGSPAPRRSGVFTFPATVHTGDDALLDEIAAYAAIHRALVFDCSRLARIEFTAASELLACLQPLQDGRRIEFRALNHPAAVLLRLLGMDAIARLQTHRY